MKKNRDMPCAGGDNAIINPPAVKEVLKDRLVYLRKRQAEREGKDRITLDEAGAAMGIPGSTLGGYEKGNTVPDAENLVAIADYYHVSIDYLTGRVISGGLRYTETGKDMGLSEDAVYFLQNLERNIKEMKNDDYLKPIYKQYVFCRRIINVLLKHENIESISGWIYHHLMNVQEEIQNFSKKEEKARTIADKLASAPEADINRETYLFQDRLEAYRSMLKSQFDFSTWALTKQLNQLIVDITLSSLPNLKKLIKNNDNSKGGQPQ
jgi:transcriptional regulator with XRE-family HTH domain